MPIKNDCLQHIPRRLVIVHHQDPQARQVIRRNQLFLFLCLYLADLEPRREVEGASLTVLALHPDLAIHHFR